MLGRGNTVAMLAMSLFTLGEVGCAGHAAVGEAPSAVSAAERNPSASACRARMPSGALEVPDGNALGLELGATGVQIYTCTASAGGPAWTFSAPEATLFLRGTVAGRHYGGPTWESVDGSTVAAAKAAAITPDPSSVPWLLLRASSHGGHGRMSEVTFVQRVDTHGGVVPTSGCDGSTVGAVARVPYTATYCLYEAHGS